MPRSYREQSRSDRPFIVTEYIPGPDGRLAAQIPSCCPVGCGSGESVCKLELVHHRRRKTGPPHPLTVLRCRTHGGSFTLYAPGYAPYQRRAVLNTAPDGQPIHGQDDRQRTDFGSTVFEAALDAERGQAWARDSGPDGVPPPERWWATQGRHLRLAARLVGVAHDLSEQVRTTIAVVLSVDHLQLREGARAVGYRAIGQAVSAVIRRMRGAARRAWQLLVCGHVIGHWSEPLRWDVERQCLERSPFRPSGTEDTT